MSPGIRLSPAVSDALERGLPIVALESSVLAQGLPPRANRQAAHRMLQAVSQGGALPAITAVVNGVPSAGLDDAELEHLLRRDGWSKVSARDVPAAMVRKAYGATTVAAALLIARQAGIEVFATGGIGGVHREPPYDESADLAELARSPVIVVCAGAKSILDLRATVERLESLGVPVIGYRTSELPGFFCAETGILLDTCVETTEEIADIFLAGRKIGREAALLIVQPPPASDALSRETVDTAVERALASAREEGVRGGAVSPFLLAAVERETNGRTLATNIALLEANSRLAAEIAVSLAARDSGIGQQSTNLS
ncbi:MAG: pseudouridine-5'-phosphate glycosidase [Anaerolineae bacterium]|nr:pseudouridine-5'-phosphate glycosidase [Gemmatimonadaceae bacterium]